MGMGYHAGWKRLTLSQDHLGDATLTTTACTPTCGYTLIDD